MYNTGVLGVATTTAGAVVLPNTGSNRTLMIVAAINVLVGSVIVITAVMRFVAKRAYKA